MVDLRPVRRSARKDVITASAQILTPDNTRHLIIEPKQWQSEAWDFFRSLGELRYAVGDWFSNAMSRVRIMPAISYPGEEPRILDNDDPVVQLTSDFFGNIACQAAIMKKFAIHLTIPGESYLVGEDTMLGRTWTVYSTNEIRIKQRARRQSRNLVSESIETVIYEVQVMDGLWRQLHEESLVVRIWLPDAQYSWKASSPAQSSLAIMREIDYYNRYISAVLLSRLASNGFLLIPNEVTFPVKEQFKDTADPFIAELVDIASKSIQNPGSAAAAIPIPLKVPSEFIEKFRHMTFDTVMGEKILEDRDAALRRLATSINMPAEILTGVGNINHWGQWQLEESAIKIHISPVAETICDGLSVGYLIPILTAAGINARTSDGGTYIVWYDVSDLAQDPDKSGAAKDLYDRGELDAQSLRDSSGFEDIQEIDMNDFKTIALKKIALGGGPDAMRALSVLTGDDSLIPPAPAPAMAPNGNQPIEPTGQPSSDVQNEPDTRPTNEQPIAPGQQR